MCPLSFDDDFSARRIAGQDLEEEIQGRGVGIGRCLTCASCETRCPEGVQFIEFVRGLRQLIPGDARRPCPHAGVFQSTARSMSGGARLERDTSWVGQGLRVAEEGEVALFVGCLPFFDSYFGKNLGIRTTDIACAAIRVLNSAGIAPVLVPQERCCGHDLLWGGEREAFTALARANVEAFRARGVKRILTACAECCRTWRVDYPEIAADYQPRVEHMAEFVAARVEAGDLRLRGSGGEPLTYQDPCRLSRHLGVTAEPQRLEEATSTGARTLVTACPKCLIHFTCAQTESQLREGKSPSIKIEDFTVVAASNLDGDDGSTKHDPVTGGRDTGGTS
jgi:Fe-S oxidoreductase